KLMAKDRPVLGSRTETTYFKHRHSSTDLDISKELDVEAKALEKEIRALPRTNFVCKSCDRYFFRPEAVNIFDHLDKPSPIGHWPFDLRRQVLSRDPLRCPTSQAASVAMFGTVMGWGSP